MGIYIYSLRAKTVQLAVSGTKVSAHLYSYAYRYSSMWRGDYGYNAHKLVEANTQRHAENVFGVRPSALCPDEAGCFGVPYVIIGDLKQGLDGSSVYANVTAPIWYDTDKFPGTPVGWVQKVGKSYALADRTEWSKGTKALRGDAWVPIRTRSVMVDGRATYESVDEEAQPTA